MITNGKFYKFITNSTPGKYSPALCEKIEELGQLCLNNIATDNYSPIMMLGSIQSGKTRAFIGLLALCFDNDFDMAIILTKCSKALVKQTVRRMDAEFEDLKSGHGTVSDVIAQNILDIDFKSASTEEEKEKIVRKFVKRYPDKKRIIVVKKQQDNVDRMNMLITKIVENGKYKRIIIVDDEADITSIGYQKDKDTEDLSLRRISGAINTARKQLNSDIQHVLMQVTATPYALYLQPEIFNIGDVMPIRPEKTVVLPTGDGYIGGQYYFIDSEDQTSSNYPKAQYLPHIVPQDEMELLNGTRKNSGKNSALTDGRVVKKENFLENNGKKYALPTFRNWLFDCLVGAAIIQLNHDYKDYYVSAVLHLAIAKNLHKTEKDLLEDGIERIKGALECDTHDSSVYQYIKTSYEDLISSAKAYGVLKIPTIDDIMEYIAHTDEDGDLEGLICSVDIKQVNSDSDVESLLNSATGELRLEDKLTIFVGGQVLDRGITIPNIINFFYGRDPKTMQQDTVMQHCRMFGYRSKQLLSVTRLYTTERLLSNMKTITERDSKLRERLEKTKGGIVYLDAGQKIVACSKDKILASDVNSILPGKRYLPVGFDIKNTGAKQKKSIDDILIKEKIASQKQYLKKSKALIDETYCNFISKDLALEILRHAYDALEPDTKKGRCNTFDEIESIFLFSMEQQLESSDKIALLVRRNRQIAKYKYRNGVQLYTDAPEDGNNEGALAQSLRDKYPVLVLLEQCAPEWKKKFWWPVYYTPEEMNIGIYAEQQALNAVYENPFSATKLPMQISNFKLIDQVGLNNNQLIGFKTKLEEIETFHKTNFDFTQVIDSAKSRKSFTCPIILKHGPTEKAEQRLLRAINRQKSKAEKTLKQLSIPPAFKKNILRYFELISNLVFDEETNELYDTIINGFEKQKSSNIDLLLIKKSIVELAKELHFMYETLGYFLPRGGGIIEIHLYYDSICKECSNDNQILPLLAYTAAHEMEHAWHYADVMTESGKWLYSRQAYLKQGWVQETIAEYFALNYAKEMNDINKRFAEDFIRSRDIQKFPADGGYSGALLIENKPNDFDNLYRQSLTDLPLTYDKYLKPLKPKS